MSFLRELAEETIGLFIDDGALAALCAALLAIVIVAALLLGFPALWSGLVLLIGCVAILAWSVLRAVG